MKKINYFLRVTAILAAALLFSGCYSVFSGGTGGLIVDAESSYSPKLGIANVDIYAYTDKSTRDSEYKSWKEGTTFSPKTSYYGHTITSADGSFTISKIVWKETKPDFGKDADFTTIYLLYYHENYGLTKDETVITSDSTSDTVYAELTAIRKSTSLNINIYDVSTLSQTSNEVLVTISVPQSTETIEADAKIYKESITGNGSITITYPRWASEEDKTNGIENEPEITLSYAQSADEITWKACSNADNEEKDYSFLEDDFEITKVVKNSSFAISLYGKATKIALPSVSGTYGDTTDTANDGKVIKMMAKDSSGQYTIDCGETTTYAQTIGSSASQTHGNFSGLGSSYYWNDTSYTGKYATIDVKFFVDGVDSGVEKTLRSDSSSYNVTL